MDTPSTLVTDERVCEVQRSGGDAPAYLHSFVTTILSLTTCDVMSNARLLQPHGLRRDNIKKP